MKMPFNAILMSVAMLMPSVAAASVYNGKIARILAVEGDAFLVYVESAPIGTVPACGATGTTTLKRYAVQASSPGGRATIASLMLAFSMDKTVFIAGRGEFPSIPADQMCNVYPDTETLNYVDIAK